MKTAFGVLFFLTIGLLLVACEAPNAIITKYYTISFNANDGSGTMADQTLATGATANLTANAFNRPGYIFSGWNTLANGTGTAYANQASFTMGTTNSTLYAQWVASQNTISFNANGGSGTMADQTLAAGATANLTANAFNRPGYIFSGWNTLANGTGTAYANQSSYTMGATSAVLFAQWVANQNTLSFNANGGSGTMADQTLATGTTASLTANAFTRPGYIFSGWNTLANGTGTTYANQGGFTMGATSAVLYAQWVANQNTLSFNANGGSGTMADQTLATGATASLTANAFTRTGYIFSGWNTQANGAGTAYANQAGFTMGTTDITVYARWVANQNTLSFNANGGSGTMADQTLATGATANLTANALTRTGYTFSGWNTQANGTGAAYANQASYTMGAVSAVMYAQWVANQNTLSFNANGGSGTMADQTLATGTTASLTANAFTRTGYTFSGWNTLANGTGTAYANQASYSMGTTNCTLYAHWVANQNTISFNANGGSGTMADQTLATGATASLTANAFTRTGYTFSGWNSLVDGTGTAYANQASFTMGTTNTTLYAQWVANQNTISFNANDGSGTMTDQTLATGATANLTANAFTRTGYTFSGWNTLANGSGTAYANQASFTMGTVDIVVYARWVANQNTVSFNANGGSGTIADQTLATGATANLTANAFTRTGYTFSSWNTLANGTGTDYANQASYTMGATSTVMYAQWVANQNTISFNANGGSGTMADQTLATGATSNLTANAFTMTGYTFSSWNTLANGTGTAYANQASYTMGAASTVMYAQWVANQNTVGFNANGGSGTMADQTLATGTTANLTANAFNRPGYIFSGWNTLANGTGTAYANQSSYTMGATSAVLYAQWVANQNTLSFNANGGSGTMADQTLATGTTTNMTANAFTRIGYTFSGWNTLANGTGTAYANQSSYTMGATSAVMYAQWVANQNIISFNANSGSGTMTDQTLATGTTANLTANVFTRTGYIFSGWNTLANGTGTFYANQSSYTMGAVSAVMYAQWVANQNIISFNANGGSGTMTDQTLATGTTANLTANAFTRTGYTFSGWNTLFNGTGTFYANQASYTMGATSVIMYARWVANQNTISFNANGGSGTMADQTLAIGATARLTPNTFTMAGYTFSGWNTLVDGTGTAYAKLASFTMGATDITLYARWVANQNTISFNANGGTGTMADQTLATGATANLTANAFTRPGYIFSRWDTLANGAQFGIINQGSYTMGATSVVLYAQWQGNQNTLSFNANGGSGTMADQTLATGATANLTANAFTRTGYTLGGWNTQANGTGTAYANQASYTMGTTNSTLYARWVANQNTISFNANGGSGTMSEQTLATGAPANLTANAFTRPGYIFSGWNTQANGTGTAYANQASYSMGATSVVLYARWVVPTILVSAGYHHTMILKTGGNLWATGFNNYGQLANGGTASIPIPFQMMEGVSAVSAGGAHTMILKTDGTLWATGRNYYGQLGDGTNASRVWEVQVMTGVSAVSAGYEHTMILKTDGTLWATGWNTHGQLGDGTNVDKWTPVQVMTGVSSVSAGYNYTMILKTDGTLWATGWNSYGQLGDGTNVDKWTPVQVMTGVSSVSAGWDHTMILKTDGTLWASGWNSRGELGDGTNVDKWTPVQVMTEVSAVSAGGRHTMILKTDGSLWATGGNYNGELGDGSTSIRSTPAQVMTGVSAVSAGVDYTMILKTDGTLWATGHNADGQLGDGTINDKSTPVLVE